MRLWQTRFQRLTLMQFSQNQSERKPLAPMPESKVIDAILRSDLYSFVQKVFPLVSPGAAFAPNWHVEAITYALRGFSPERLNASSSLCLHGVSNRSALPSPSPPSCSAAILRDVSSA